MGDGVAQIDLELAPRADLGVHLRLEEAIGAAPGGFGGIHRHVRVLQDLVQRRCRARGASAMPMLASVVR